MSEPISVSQLNTIIYSTLSGNRALKQIAVFGEISSFKYSGPHAYFTLKDKEGAIACTCFYAKKTYNPQKEGESVIVVGSVDYYGKSGRLSLRVDSIQPVGKGALHIMLEKLKQKLLEEGLFATEHKKAIPRFAKRVCVVTSKTGAVIRDIVRTVRNKNNVIDIYVYDVRVQGEYSAKEMCHALSVVDELGFDCIILARGGGSFEDLMPFNDEELARVIYAMKTPIMSAVGHETDFTIADFVADCRAATPTAAGELVAYDVEATKMYIITELSKSYNRLVSLEREASNKAKHAFNSLSDKALRKFDKATSRVILTLHKLDTQANNLIKSKEQKLDKLLTSLEGNNPVKLLKNGYYRVSRKGSSVPFSDIEVGDKLSIVGYEGQLEAEVISKTLNSKGE